MCLWNTGEVHTVEFYARVRRAVIVDKMSGREVARQFGLARETVRKMLRYSAPPGYADQQQHFRQTDASDAPHHADWSPTDLLRILRSAAHPAPSGIHDTKHREPVLTRRGSR